VGGLQPLELGLFLPQLALALRDLAGAALFPRLGQLALALGTFIAVSRRDSRLRVSLKP